MRKILQTGSWKSLAWACAQIVCTLSIHWVISINRLRDTAKKFSEWKTKKKEKTGKTGKVKWKSLTRTLAWICSACAASIHFKAHIFRLVKARSRNSFPSPPTICKSREKLGHGTGGGIGDVKLLIPSQAKRFSLFSSLFVVMFSYSSGKFILFLGNRRLKRLCKFDFRNRKIYVV